MHVYSIIQRSTLPVVLVIYTWSYSGLHVVGQGKCFKIDQCTCTHMAGTVSMRDDGGNV